MTMIEEQISDFNWDEAAQLTGATFKQVKFARARVAGANATEAARRAGYVSKTPEGLRSIAAQTARSKTVLSLLALAAAGNQGVACEIISVDQRKRIYSSMIKNGSESARVAAGRILMELEGQEREAQADKRMSLEDFAAAIMKDGSPDGALTVMVSMFNAARTLVGLPLPEKIYPVVHRHFPGLLLQLVKLLPPSHTHHAEPILKDAQKFIDADTARRIPDAESKRPIEANGKAVA
jgi:hypothetical protein